MTREEAVKEIEKAFEPAFANYIITALTEGATVSDKEPTTKNDIEVDCISRKAVKDYIHAHIHEIITESGIDKNAHTNEVLRALLNGVDIMPSVTPIRPKGHWLGDSAGYKCNICGHDLLEIAHSIDYIDFKKPNYCPNCGADMRGNEE